MPAMQQMRESGKEFVKKNYPVIYQCENKIEKAIEALKQDSTSTKYVERQIKIIATELEKIAAEIKKENSAYVKQRNPSIDTATSMAVMHYQTITFLSLIFTRLKIQKIFDATLVQHADGFIQLLENLRATHKKTFKLIHHEKFNYQRMHEHFLSDSVIIRDYILMVNKDINEVEYLDHQLVSIISLNKILHLRKDQTLGENIVYYIELLSKKLSVAKFYLDKNHLTVAIDYFEKLIPLFQLINKYQHKLLTSPLMPESKPEAELFESCLRMAYTINATLGKNLYLTEIKYPDVFAGVLYARSYQILRKCYGVTHPKIVEMDTKKRQDNYKILQILRSPHFNWKIDLKENFLHLYFDQDHFHPSIMSKFKNTIDWSYQDRTLTIKNLHEMGQTLMGKAIDDIGAYFDEVTKRIAINKEIAEKPAINIATNTNKENTTSENNNNQTNTSTSDENNEKQPKVKTKGVATVEEKEKENLSETSKLPKIYKASELGFSKQFENYPIIGLAGKGIRSGIHYGIYDFHPDQKSLKKLGLSDTELTQFENKFNEANLVTDSKTGIVITKNENFQVEVHEPDTKPEPPKVVGKIQLHTGLKIKIANKDHRIKAEPVEAVETIDANKVKQISVLWLFNNPTTHKKEKFNISTSNSDDSCNNNQSMETSNKK